MQKAHYFFILRDEILDSRGLRRFGNMTPFRFKMVLPKQQSIMWGLCCEWSFVWKQHKKRELPLNPVSPNDTRRLTSPFDLWPVEFRTVWRNWQVIYCCWNLYLYRVNPSAIDCLSVVPVRVSDIEQATNTGEIPLLFSRSDVGPTCCGLCLSNYQFSQLILYFLFWTSWKNWRQDIWGWNLCEEFVLIPNQFD